MEITLPEGYKVDELPEPTRAIYPFAEYVSKAESAGNTTEVHAAIQDRDHRGPSRQN